jgi:phosphotransferase family enzyme
MLTTARAALVELGVLAPTDPLPPMWSRMSGNLILMVYPRGESSYLVKFAMRTRLDREFRGLSLAHTAMPRNVPRPLGLISRGEHQVLVTQGVRHEPFTLRLGQAQYRMLEHGVGALLAASLRQFQASATDAPVDIQDALRDAGDAIGWSAWRDYWIRVQPRIATLPRVLQHGDLAMTNIAIADGDLVFFDWEDFGLVDLVGFDLAVVLLSLLDFDSRRLRERLATTSAEARLLALGCARLEVPPDVFLELFPAYLSVFAKLKRTLKYDPLVSARAIAVLRDWVRNGPPRLAPG